MTHTSSEEPDIPFYERLWRQSKSDMPPLKTAVVQPTDTNALTGAMKAAEEGLIDPLLVGPKETILETAKKHELKLDEAMIEDVEDSEEAVRKAVQIVKEGKADALMKGHIHTDELLRRVLHPEHGLRAKRRMSHVFCMDIPSEKYPKPLWLSDAAVNIQPSMEDKRDIIQNAIDLFHGCGFGAPKVAILSATEKITSDISSTVEAAALCKMADRGSITGGVLDGPLAFDNAISKEAAETKGIDSEVAGEVDILIVPDLESGNMLYKQMKYLSGYNAAGVVMGASVPIMLTSRAGGIKARLASAALAKLYSQSQGDDT